MTVYACQCGAFRSTAFTYYQSLRKCQERRLYLVENRVGRHLLHLRRSHLLIEVGELDDRLEGLDVHVVFGEDVDELLKVVGE